MPQAEITTTLSGNHCDQTQTGTAQSDSEFLVAALESWHGRVLISCAWTRVRKFLDKDSKPWICATQLKWRISTMLQARYSLLLDQYRTLQVSKKTTWN